MKRMNRWKIASESEKEFWSKCKRIGNTKEFWYEYFKNFGIDFSFFYGRKVLDVGCGPCGAIQFVERASLAIGVDPIIMDGGFPAVISVGEALPFVGKLFDVVICFNVLDHVIDHEKMIREISRTLVLGGLLFLSTHVFPRYLGKVLDATSGYVDKPHPYHFSSSEVKLLLEMNGLSIVRSKISGIDANGIKAKLGRLLRVKKICIIAKKGT